MPLAPRRLAALVCALAVPMALAFPALANTGHVLAWQGKVAPTEPAAPPAPAVVSGSQSYPVPPSPYGQVGDPFARGLSWPAKASTKPATKPAPKPQTVASVQMPPVAAPLTVPQAPTPIAPKVPQASVSAPVPLAAPKPVTVPKSALAAATPPAPTLAPVPAAKPAATAPGAGYQVPATSKYAARIAAARAAQAQSQEQTQAQQQKPAQTAPKSSTATAPEPTAQMATEETDHVFIPGEQYTSASDAPRYYSLHRAYGLTPDPITVDHTATGALLGSAPDSDTGASSDQGDARPAADPKKATP